MIARIHRFRGLNAVTRAYRGAKQVRGPLMSLRYTSGRAGSPWRAAVVVSRKVSTKAVIRNRVRRRVYEQLRLAKPPIKGSIDLIITVFSVDVATMPAKQLYLATLKLLNQAGILQSKPDDTKE